LGTIPSPEIKNARKHLHALIDPPWQNFPVERRHVYEWISKAVGYEFHVAEVSDIEEARRVYRIARDILRKKGYSDVLP